MKGIPLCIILGAMLWALIVNVIIAWPSELGSGSPGFFVVPDEDYCMMSARHGVEIWMGDTGTFEKELEVI